MATLTIQRSTQRTFSIKAWLNAKSAIYSEIMEEPITHLQVLRVHLILACIILAASTAETSLPVSLLFAIFAAKLVYDLNTKSDKI